MLPQLRARSIWLGVAIVIGSMALSLLLAETARFLIGYPPTARHYLLSLGIPAVCAPIFMVPLVWTNHRLRAIRAELERLVRTDVLTGLPNRRGFFERAEESLAAADRSAEPVAAMMVDIDRFKSINDRYGHAAGDRIIQLVASQIAHALAAAGTADAVAARIGGEEYVLLLRGLPREATEAVALQICGRVREMELLHGDAVVRSTVSIGIAMRRPGQGIDALVRAADAAVYKAKRAGRDRYIVAIKPRPDAQAA